MKIYNPPSKGMTAQDQQRLVLPVLVSAVFFLLILATYSALYILAGDITEKLLLVLGCLGIFSSFILYYLILPKSNLLDKFKWVIAVVTGLGLGLIAIFIPDQIFSIFYILFLLSVIIIAVINGREATFLMITIVTILALFSMQGEMVYWPAILQVVGLPIVMLAVSETYLRSSDMLFRRILRMAEINDFARKIASSLETEQVISLLSASVQDALDADTYIIGLVVDKEFLQLDLFYDDGDYFPPERIPLSGTLSGWVIRNDQPLFLPDLRHEPALEDVRLKIIGKDKISLSWMGVPIHTTHFKGIIAVASYQPNAFDRMDMQLLENLAQQAAFALDNAHHHTEVEFQSQLDSLTEVYNHGFFLKMLGKQAELRRTTQSPMSLIMLDVDHFKQYNDTYGHLFGDTVLQTLVNTIRSHIKNTDFIGRWGGEEFAVALPGANGQQALMVARRIQFTMSDLKLKHQEKGKVPAPTVSQGIAIFPLETDDIYKLIDIADQRLYIAKERGRNEVEPDEKYWEATIPLRR
jgi:two-component system cell cycle response regulator